MEKIRDLLARDLNQTIEEIIKVDQTDERSVFTEITEYVATERIRDQYRLVLKAYAEAPADLIESVGVWISGFFGSGKSSFAKNLGYVLANRTVLGHSAASLFKQQVADKGLGELIDFINARIPTEVIMFDVQVDKAVVETSESLAQIMYRMLLRHLDYAEDFDIAELEIELESEGKLAEFIRRVEAKFALSWSLIRKGAQKMSRASAVLHEMDPAIYSSPDSWAKSWKGTEITVRTVVERSFDLMARRRPGRGLVFIIDEVGQYVARSGEKIENLRAIVEEFGREGKNRIIARKAIAPVWVIVTSQEKLDEVVAAIDDKRVELARLQDRFRYRVDLSPADIREVATRRVLSKKDAAKPLLKSLYNQFKGHLNTACRLERTTRRSEVSENDFIQFYPYLPHFIELSIDIMSGIRRQPGAPRHHGGSNRTIIKQAYEMLVSERTALGNQPIGQLVTLDKIFELVEGLLSNEKQKDIGDIKERFAGDPEDRGWALRVAKAICLLEYVKDLPRTEANIAALLVDQMGQPAPVEEVKAALERLVKAQFVRNTDEGYKLLTAQEKTWDTERRGYLQPKPKDRNDILRSALGEIFSDPKLKTYRHRDLASFPVGISVNGISVGEEGQLKLALHVAEDASEFSEKVEAARSESRKQDGGHWNHAYWVFALTPEIDNLIANLYASGEMIRKYDQLRAQGRLTTEEATSLTDERQEETRLKSRLRDKLVQALLGGVGLFRGVSKDPATLGRNLSEALGKFWDWVVPDLYPKLQIGARQLKGDEAGTILKAANLAGLPAVFYGSPQGLNLVVKESSNKYVVNQNAEVAKEVLDYIRGRYSYGNRVTGKELEEHFKGVGYGWDRDVLRVVLATLLRGGVIEVTYQGKRFASYQEPEARIPFENNMAFKTASFAPREALDRKTLVAAAKNFEEITGEEVDIEEETIAAAFKKLAEGERNTINWLKNKAIFHRLPVADLLSDYDGRLAVILNTSSEDAVRLLAGEGITFKQQREQISRICAVLDDASIEIFEQARLALSQMWPVIKARGLESTLSAGIQDLEALLQSETFYERLREIKTITEGIVAGYKELYFKLHAARRQAYLKAMSEIRSRPEWGSLPSELERSLLASLASRACDTVEWTPGDLTCRNCHASIGQLESDLAATSALKDEIIVRLQEITAGGSQVKRVRLKDFFAPNLDSEEEIDAAVERLREHLHKLLAEGVKIVVE